MGMQLGIYTYASKLLADSFLFLFPFPRGLNTYLLFGRLSSELEMLLYRVLFSPC